MVKKLNQRLLLLHTVLNLPVIFDDDLSFFSDKTTGKNIKKAVDLNF